MLVAASESHGSRSAGPALCYAALSVSSSRERRIMANPEVHLKLRPALGPQWLSLIHY